MSVSDQARNIVCLYTTK